MGLVCLSVLGLVDRGVVGFRSGFFCGCFRRCVRLMLLYTATFSCSVATSIPLYKAVKGRFNP